MVIDAPLMPAAPDPLGHSGCQYCDLAITPIPETELARQAALDRYGLVGTLPEAAFDDLTAIAAELCDAPSAFISLVSNDIQWLKAEIGIGTQELPRSGSFCGHTILDAGRVLVVPDTLMDPRFSSSPFVVGPPHIRFYAGAPLVTPDGQAIGSLCVIDPQPRTLGADRIASLRALARQVVAQMELRLKVQEMNQEIVRRERAEEYLQQERDKSERLLGNMLPAAIAQRLKETPGPIADRFEAVTVLFADLVNFTPLAERLDPQLLVALLDDLFCRFDRLVQERKLEKIKTIGDAYMAAAGLPTPMAAPEGAAAIADLALAMQRITMDFSADFSANFSADFSATFPRLQQRTGAIDAPLDLQLRIGIETGPVVAGTIGTLRYAYDLWGDTVNMASRMETQGQTGKIQLGPNAYGLLRDRYSCYTRGRVPIKGKGLINTYWLDGPRRLSRR
jgi:adenylate cyclase